MAGLLSLVIFLSLHIFPPIGVFLAVMAPLPVLQLVATGRRSFVGWGWVAVMLAGAALVTQADWVVGVLGGYLLLVAWPAQAIETWLRRPWSTGRFLAIVALVALVAEAAMLVATFYPALAPDAIRSSIETQWGELARQIPAVPPLEELPDEMVMSLRVLIYLVPATLAAYVLWIAVWLRPRLALLGLPRGQDAFASYTSEEWLPVAFVLGGIGWVFLPEPGKWLATNLLVVVLCLYFVHGLAIIHYYLGPQLTASRWVRVGVGMVFLPIAPVLSALGLADSFIRLRRGGDLDEGSIE